MEAFKAAAFRELEAALLAALKELLRSSTPGDPLSDSAFLNTAACLGFLRLAEEMGRLPSEEEARVLSGLARALLGKELPTS